jgi:iron complex outermembrane recepter protein
MIAPGFSMPEHEYFRVRDRKNAKAAVSRDHFDGRPRTRRSLSPALKKLVCALTAFASAASLFAQEAYRNPAEPEPPAEPPRETTYRSPAELKKLSLEDLVDAQITSAARRPEFLSRASSAIDVVTGEDIRRSGVTNLPDALRLAIGMQVAQVDGHSWAISTRGFNISAANKVQVLMDGRNLYTPLFSGVFWDVQHTFLPDVEQIEVIRGPGATLWGANAVNGVINIRTKSAEETQGTLIYGGAGNEETGMGGVRYGGKIGRDTFYRVYVMHQSRDSLSLEGGGDARDDTRITQGGFRIDSHVTADDTVTFQGDAYGGRFGQLTGADIEVDGQNLIARWTRVLAKDSSLTLQSYFDRTHRLIPTVFEENRSTFDLELQHSFRSGQHDIVYGANYRLSHDDIGNLGPALAFLPDEKTAHLISAYAQDEWHLVPEKFSITGGSKFEYNSFSGFEIQPTGRFTWLPGSGQTVWGAISRAVRTPTRIDQDLVAPNPSTGAAPVLAANPDFDSEVLIAYELGYRIKPANNVSFDFCAFYNDYDNIRSVEPQGPTGRPILLENKLTAKSFGGSAGVKWRIADWWRVDGSASFLQIDFDRKPGSADPNPGRSEGNDPTWRLLAHSAVDLPGNVQFDSYLRYVGDLPGPATPSYLQLDMRLAWSPTKNFEIALVGRNLLDEKHPEFRGTTITREVGRSVYGTFRWSF